jgi:Centromere DNA-binding protein complex CBF3 subunit, domain 2/Transcriptional activator of glycolytic enzymes
MGEFSQYSVANWKENAKWFNIKFLADVYGNDKETEMVSDSYAEHVKTVLTKLHLPTNKLRHLECGAGTKELDACEVNEQEIRRMGQWNQTVYDQSYLSKLPMAAMKSLAGFTTANGMYYNPCTVVMPSLELLKMTAIGSWSFDMLDALENEEEEKPTAIACLNWFNQLCVVFLQDLAAMFHLYPDRKDSALFRWTPVLSTPEFKEFQVQMAEALSSEQSPLDASLEKVLPDVFTRFQGVDDKMSSLVDRKVEAVVSHIDSGFQPLRQDQSDFLRESYSAIAASLINTGVAMMGCANPPNSPGASKASGKDLYAGSPVVTSPDPSPDPQQQREKEPATRSPHATFVLRAKHNTLADVWNEWFGQAEFTDGFGGVAGRNSRFGGKWRKEAQCLDASQYSRTQRLVKAITQQSTERKVQPEEIVAEWESLFQESNRSLATFVRALQNLNYIGKRKTRRCHTLVNLLRNSKR